MVIITVERVPRKLLAAYADKNGDIPAGVTLTPRKGDRFKKIEILIQEKLPQYKSRLVLAHEMFHAYQNLAGCAMDEQANEELDVIMVHALKEKKKGRRYAAD